MSLFKKGLLPVDKTITKIYSLEEINQAISMMKSDNPGRVMIKFNQD